MINKIAAGILAAFILAITNFAFAAQIPAPPAKDIYVSDFANMIDAETAQKILSIGKTLDEKYNAQIVIVTVETLNGEQITDYASELFGTWKIGGKDLNNGVLIFVAKKERRFKIEIGSGLNGAINDDYKGAVLGVMTENFQNGKISEGLLKAYSTLTKKIYEESGGEVPTEVLKNVHESFNAENAPNDSTSKINESDTLNKFITIIFGTLMAILFIYAVAALIVCPALLIIGGIVYIVSQRRYGGMKWAKSFAHFTRLDKFFGAFLELSGTNVISKSKDTKSGKNSKRSRR